MAPQTPHRSGRPGRAVAPLEALHRSGHRDGAVASLENPLSIAPAPSPHVIVIAANPYRGAARPRQRVQTLAAAVATGGAPVRVLWDAAERARLLGDARALAGVRCVVAAGGDGTVASVINELAADVPLAVLPLGNENVLARALGLPDEPVAAARAIVAGRTRRLDLGRATTSAGARRFALMLSAGFDADVIHRVAAWRSAGGAPRQVSRLSYVRPLATALVAYGHPPITVVCEGAHCRGAYCIVSNLPDYALALSLTPSARADDGALDWLTFERGGLPALAAYAWAVARRRHAALGHVRSGRARRLTLTSATPVPVQLDGDPWGFTPAAVEVLPGALAVVVV
jgi:diacylglycerol kinase (ATP)